MEISIYRNITDTVGASGDLFKFFLTDKWKDKADAVRNEPIKEERNKLKKDVPACTPSGLFSERKASGLIRHSGYICIDIDGADNPRINNWDEMITQLGNLNEVAFAGLSISGKGAFTLIQISNPDKHLEHFKALEEDFLRYGIIIDHACKDVSRMRIYSYNANPYVNMKAKKYTRIFKPKPISKNYHSSGGDVEELVRKIVETGTNIVPDYQSWFEVGASLANVYNGRELFHAISRIDASKYNAKECDRQFGKFKSNQFSINTLFYYAKNNGVTLK